MYHPVLTCTYTHKLTCTHTQTCTHTHLYKHADTDTHTYTYVHTHKQVYICVHVLWCGSIHCIIALGFIDDIIEPRRTRRNTVNMERFSALNICNFSPMKFFTEILSRCIGHQCLLLIYSKKFMGKLSRYSQKLQKPRKFSPANLSLFTVYVRILSYYRINTSTHTGENMVTFHSRGPSMI